MARMSMEESGKKPKKAVKSSGASPAKIAIVAVGLLVGGVLILNNFYPIFGAKDPLPENFKPLTDAEKTEIAEEEKKEKASMPKNTVTGGS